MTKITNRLVTSIAALSTVAAFLATTQFADTVSADKIQIEPMFTYGESLNDSQFQTTKQALGVEAGVQEIEVRVDELNGLLQDDYPYYQVYSSTYITPAQNNGDITVDIITPQTITTITELQYENAALTAGAVDVDIKVASAVPVDGSGALAGVYKAFQSQGSGLNNEAVAVAQDELGVTSAITEENTGKEGYSDESLNAALADIKAEISRLKDEQGGSITVEEISFIVNNVINGYNLDKIITPQNIELIINQMKRFSELELTQEQKDAISSFGQNLKDATGRVIESAESAWNGIPEEDKQQAAEDAKGIWASIVRFFTNLFGNVFGGE